MNMNMNIIEKLKEELETAKMKGDPQEIKEAQERYDNEVDAQEKDWKDEKQQKLDLRYGG